MDIDEKITEIEADLLIAATSRTIRAYEAKLDDLYKMKKGDISDIPRAVAESAKMIMMIREMAPEAFGSALEEFIAQEQPPLLKQINDHKVLLNKLYVLKLEA